MRDPVYRDPGLTVLDDVAAKLIQHPGHILAVKHHAARSNGVSAGEPLCLRQPRTKRPGQRGQQDPGRPSQRSRIRHIGRLRADPRQVLVERVLDRVADLLLPARLGGVHRGCPQLVGDEAGQQEGAAPGYRCFLGQVTADCLPIHVRTYTRQPPGDVSANVPATPLLHGRVIQVQFRSPGRQQIQQRRVGLTAPQLPGGHDHHCVRGQAHRQILCDGERLPARLI